MHLYQFHRIGLIFGLFALSVLSLNCSHSADEPPPLVTGKNLEPPTSTPVALGDLPMNMISSSDGKFAIACGMGYRNAIWSIRTADAALVDHVNFASRVVPRPRINPNEEDTHDAGAPPEQTNGVYYGLAMTADGIIYAAQGAHDSIAILSLTSSGELSAIGTIPAKVGDFPAGLALDDHRHLFVSNNSAGGKQPSYRWPASMAIYDTVTKTELGRYTFDSPESTSNFPLAIAVLHDGSKAYVASERDGVVYVLNTDDPEHIDLGASIVTGSHPIALLMNRDQSRLFVANAQSDTVSVIDTDTDRSIGTVLLRPDAARGLPGATPTALALSPDEKTMFVTLSDMNAVGVVDVGSLSLRGFIPAGWYPSAILATGDNRLLVLNAKGTSVRNPNAAHAPFAHRASKDKYVLNDIPGNLQAIAIPSNDDLAEQTTTVLKTNHLDRISNPENPLAGIGLGAGKIKHIIYIVKENRTYDQVLGDESRGDGDPSLVLFGREVTPNQHALAERFVLLDNCYANGEVSGDGWTWSTQGIANPYTERNIPYHYSNRGRTFDFEGENNGYITGGFPAKDADGKPLSTDPNYNKGAPAVPDVAAANTHLWDIAHAAGISYRNYGFFLSMGDADKKTDITHMPENYPTVPGLQPPGHDLAGVTDADFRRFDLDYPDSNAPKIYFDQTGDKNCQYRKQKFGKYDMPSRFAEWNREFAEMVAKDPTGNAVPALMTVRLPHDHTQGLSPRRHSPASEVADNDCGIGELVEVVSHSAIWQSTAIFIIEDDAQSGTDHVDCHRTTGYAISPWIKQASVDHHFYNTDSMLRTIELLLGLPPMSQYDAIATPIMDWDTSPTNNEPYKAILPAKDLIAAINPAPTSRPTAQAISEADRLARLSEQLDFDHPDAAPAALVNEMVWKSVKGMNSKMPAVRSSLISVGKPVKDDDD